MNSEAGKCLFYLCNLIENKFKKKFSQLIFMHYKRKRKKKKKKK